MSTASVLIPAEETQRASTPRYTLLLSTDPALIDAAQRLRHDVFTTEPGFALAGASDGRDADRFDEFCDHLLVREDNTGELVGCYRMLPPPWTFTQVLPEYSDDFDGTLGRQWSWVRQPSSGTGFDANGFRFDTQNAELFEDSNSASILTEAAPPGDFVVETGLRFNVPPSGACCNYAQAGLVIYRDDDDYVKLVHSAIWETRDTEFGKEVPKNDGFPRYGSTFAGPPGEVTWLRISRTTVPEGTEQYTAYTSRDGQWWQRGGTWTHSLGTNARIGLVSMSRAGFTAEFRYVHVYAASAPTQPLSR